MVLYFKAFKLAVLGFNENNIINNFINDMTMTKEDYDKKTNSDVGGMIKDSNGCVKISCTPTLVKLLEAKILILKPLFISLYGEIKGLKYYTRQ